MTPADELRAAADKLRALANVATEVPWCRWRDQEHIPGWDGFLMIGDSTEPTDEDNGNPVAKVYVESDADYIAAMHPGVGEKLARLLETEANTWAGDEVHYRCTPQTCTLDAALAVARAINGGEPA